MNKILVFGACMAILISGTAMAGSEHGKHWSYEGDTGPDHWGEFSATCANGMQQSPINIEVSDVQQSALKPIKFHYDIKGTGIKNNGHAIQVNIPQGRYIVVDEERFNLLQFHFHSPSEEQINGKNLDMVAHLVHANAKDELAVVAVLFEKGKSNPALAKVWKKMPEHAGKSVNVMSIDAAALLPADKGYYHLMGSLTTPPCSENVKWYVLKNSVSIGAKQLKKFHELYNGTNRPVQPLNGRIVTGH